MNFDSFTFIINTSFFCHFRIGFQMSVLGCCRFWLLSDHSRGAGGQRQGGIYLQKAPALSPPPLVLVLDFLCSLFSSFVVFLQGQDSRLHILCDVRKECKELNESLDEMCPSRGRLICNKTPNLADALWPDTQCPQVVHICGTLESSNPPDFDPPWLSRQDVSFEGESNIQ